MVGRVLIGKRIAGVSVWEVWCGRGEVKSQCIDGLGMIGDRIES